ncbi:MAG TPA: hypothetical protein VKA37_11980 [Halobacteriales archaeon]|nr:hypothetical protein [Halobacteriales archaeon]
MSSFRTAMEAFPYVFHSITILGVGILVLIYLEWDDQDARRSSIGAAFITGASTKSNS